MNKFALSNGKTIEKPLSKIWMILGIVILLTVFFWYFFITYNKVTLSNLGDIFRQMFTIPPISEWRTYYGSMIQENDIINLLIQTVQMSFAGTIIGSLIAVPVAILASRNIVKLKAILIPIRFILNLVRSIPLMVMALLGVFLVGTGILAGIFGIALFSFGIMAKMLFEVIETVDMNPFEALESTGANRIVAFRYAVIPQILPVFVSYIIYIFEINIRASAVLGYVGAKGIGIIFKEHTLYDWDIVGFTIILLFVVILVIQLISNYLRRKLL